MRHALLRALTLPLTLLWLGYSLGIFWSEGSRGFPDSHLTDYDRAVSFPNAVLGYAGLGTAFCVALLGTFARRHLTRAKLWFFVALFAMLLVLHLFAFPWYFQVYRGLEHGQGG